MHLPNTLPDETLFSRYVRHMTLLGLSDKDYLQRLFSKPRTSIHPYLTIGIQKASLISEEGPIQIYREQTLGRFFSYFMKHQADNIYNTMLADDGNVAFRASQLVSFRESEKLSLKFCPQCTKEDLRSYGVAYWHRNHQIPGVEACSVHKVWLIHQDLPASPHIKTHLLPATSEKPLTCSNLSYKFSLFTKQLLEKITENDDIYYQNSLPEKILESGYNVGIRMYNRVKLTSELYRYIKGLTHNAPTLLPYSDKDYRYLSYLLSGEVSQHPFKYLLVEFWLHNIENSNKTELVENDEVSNKEDSENIEWLCVRLLRQHESLAEISRLIGKSRCYVKSVALKKKISYQKKPYILTDVTIKKILVLAYRGFHRNYIAETFQISTGSVEQVISSETGLVERRRRNKFESKRRRYKTQILRAIQLNPAGIKQEIKASCSAASHWLYTHEKSWLDQTLPAPTKPIVRSKIDWNKRDLEFADQTKKILLLSKEKITLASLDKELGDHGWLIRDQRHFPITMTIFNLFKSEDEEKSVDILYTNRRMANNSLI